MKKILLSLAFAIVFLPRGAFAVPSCAESLMPAFTANQASEICDEFSAGVIGVLGNAEWAVGRNFGDTANINVWQVSVDDDTVLNSSASDDLLLQLEDDASRLIGFDAGSDAALRMFFGDAGTTATQILLVSGSTSDADDDSSLRLTGAGAWATDGTRGATIVLPGEEVAGGADITYNAGASDTHIFSVAGTAEVTLANDSMTVSGASFSFIPGATSLLFRDTANAQTNLGITDAGVVTARAGVVATAGGVTATAGDVVITAGDITVTTGDLNIPAAANLGLIAENGANTACDTTCTQGCVAGYDAGTSAFVACTSALADSCLCAAAGS